MIWFKRDAQGCPIVNSVVVPPRFVAFADEWEGGYDYPNLRQVAANLTLVIDRTVPNRGEETELIRFARRFSDLAAELRFTSLTIDTAIFNDHDPGDYLAKKTCRAFEEWADKVARSLLHITPTRKHND